MIVKNHLNNQRPEPEARLLTGDADRAEELPQGCLVKLYPR